MRNLLKERKVKTSLIVLVFALVLAGGWAIADNIVVEFTAGQYTIEDIDAGELIHMSGCGSVSSPGTPALPLKVYQVALPPDVVWDSVSVSVVEKTEESVAGDYNIAPAPPVRVLDGEGDWEWGDATNVVNGKDMDIYGQNAFWPAVSADLHGKAQMRKWKFVNVAFYPFKYNPVTKQLVLCKSASVKIEMTRDPNLVDQRLLNDSIMDGKAATKFVNYQAARAWYNKGGMAPLGVLASYDYVIITTEDIYAGSGSKLGTLKTHLENLGHTVLIVTESHSYGDSDAAGGYGAKTGQAPNGTDDKVRKWLMDNYPSPPDGYGIVYVLLIGNPSANGDLPMKTCYPGTGYTVPTDYYFADLTGDWDSDGDEKFGENGQDDVDFEPEVYVARIPVYSAAYSTLDGIIQKEIDYDTASGDLDWRLQVLFPLSFPWAGTDPSYYSHDMETQYLTARHFSTYGMYEDYNSYCSSAYTPDEVLDGGTGAGTAYNRWTQHPYGMVWWFGHGNYNIAVVGYDEPGSGSDCKRGTLFYSSWCPSLDDSHPAFTFQISCLNGNPAYSTNLGYSLLKNGAINTACAAQVSYGESGNFYYTRHYGGSQDIGYYYAEGLTDYAGANGPCAKAFYEANAYLSAYDSSKYAWHNYFTYNLYGCPHTQIYGDLNNYIKLDSFAAKAKGDKIVLTWQTGAEIENAGFLLYRTVGDGNFLLVSDFIAAKGSASAGASYSFVDKDVVRGVNYCYYLVDLDTSGKWTPHGPACAEITLPRRLQPIDIRHVAAVK